MTWGGGGSCTILGPGGCSGGRGERRRREEAAEGLRLQSSGVDPPLCSRRACLPTAFIAISVPLRCDGPLLASVPFCRSLSAPNGGKSAGLFGSGHQRRVMGCGGLGLGRGVHVVFHCGSSCDPGGRAFAGHTPPLAALTLVNGGWRVQGRGEVSGQPSRSLSPTWAFLWALGIAKSPVGTGFFEADQICSKFTNSALFSPWTNLLSGCWYELRALTFVFCTPQEPMQGFMVVCLFGDIADDALVSQK